jgi:hypothetical protein
MGMVMIMCPKTGRPVPTGFGMDKQSFKTADMSQNSFAPCPACGGMHTWDKKDGWVME